MAGVFIVPCGDRVILNGVAKMVCRVEFESMDLWRDYLASSTEQDAGKAIDDLLRLACSFSKQRYGISTRERLQKFIDVGESIYANRFGRLYVPF